MADDGTLSDIISAYLNSIAIFGYDNVASMKTAENLIAGSYAKTLGYSSKNDGGGATYKIREITNSDVVDDRFIVSLQDEDLVAELILNDSVINVLTIGAGVAGHFAEAVNYAIQKGTNHRVYIPKGDYYAESTINVHTNNTVLESDAVIRANAGVTPIISVYGWRSVLRLNGRFFGDGTNTSVFLQVGDETHSAENHNIYFHTVNDVAVGVKFYIGDNKGIAYNTVTFDRIEHNKYGILLQTSDIGVNYIAENVFRGGQINCKESSIGIQTIKGTNMSDKFGENVFEHIAIDGPTDGVKNFVNLQFAAYNRFSDMRFSEGLGEHSDYAIYLDNCNDNRFSSKYRLFIDQIYDNSTNSVGRNYFEDGLRIESGTNLWKGVNKFFTQFGKCILERDDAMNMEDSIVGYAYNGTTIQTAPDYYVIGGTTVRAGSDNAGTYTFTLPQVFDKRCINRFFLTIQYKVSGAEFIFNDHNGNLVAKFPTGTTLSKKSYEIVYCGTAGVGNTNPWKVIPLDFNA